MGKKNISEARTIFRHSITRPLDDTKWSEYKDGEWPSMSKCRDATVCAVLWLLLLQTGKTIYFTPEQLTTKKRDWNGFTFHWVPSLLPLNGSESKTTFFFLAVMLFVVVVVVVVCVIWVHYYESEIFEEGVQSSESWMRAHPKCTHV